MKSELGWLLFQLSGNADRALIYLEQARRLDDEVPRRRRLDEGQRTDLFERLARVELVAGDYPAAITHSQVALALAAEPRRGEPAMVVALRDRLAGLREQWSGASGESGGADETATAPDATARTTLAGLEAYFADDFASAADHLQSAAAAELVSWLGYFRHAAAARDEGASPAMVQTALDALDRMQPVLGATAALQNARWRGASRLPCYGLADAGPALEGVIQGAPGTPLAAAARAELGRLLGLSAEQAARLRTAAELDQAFSEYLASRDAAELAGALGMLGLPDSTYVLTTVVGLTILRQTDAGLAVLLEERGAVAAGRERERLDAILAELPAAPPSAGAEESQ